MADTLLSETALLLALEVQTGQHEIPVRRVKPETVAKTGSACGCHGMLSSAQQSQCSLHSAAEADSPTPTC